MPRSCKSTFLELLYRVLVQIGGGLTSLSEVWSSWVVVSMPVSIGGVSMSFCYSVREVRLVR